MAFFCLATFLPAQAFNWETATSRGREYVSLRSFCLFYRFPYQVPDRNERFTTRNAQHSLSLKTGSNDMYLDGVHYVLSFPIESGDHDWLVSRMDLIKLFEPILRPKEVSTRHTIKGVVIDAGHGGTDNGATSRLGSEKNYTLKTAFVLEDLLKKSGLKTVLTRRTDVFVDLYERAHIASIYQDYCFVSIHFNSASQEAHGLETYCLSPRGAASTSSAYLTRGDIQKLPGNDDDTMNILLASMVHSEIIRLNPGDQSADRGVKRARFVVIKANLLPAILVEGGFVSNRMESARINQPEYRQRLAEAIARGVIRFINVMGNDNYSLPGNSSVRNDDDDDAPKTPPRALPVALPVVPAAPSGLAKDAKPGKSAKVAPAPAPTPKATAPKKTSSSTSTRSSRNKKKTETAADPSTAPAPVAESVPPPPPVVAVPAPEPEPPPQPRASTSLNLSEPMVPTSPSPGADKAPPEPDEPPTVNIYPTPPAKKDAPTQEAVTPGDKEP